MTALAIGDILAGREPPKHLRTFQPVWRNSYYEGQLEHRIWKPIGDGSARTGKRFTGALVKAAREMEKRTKAERQAEHPGARNGVLGRLASTSSRRSVSSSTSRRARSSPRSAPSPR
jgi:hypothetical protein